MKKTKEHKKKLSKIMEDRWKDPEYRAKMIEKQRKAGLR